MSDAAVVPGSGADPTVGVAAKTLLVLAAVGAMLFAMIFAVHYLTLNPQVYGQYWPRRYWMLLHIGGGMMALLTGPGQLWMGLTLRRLDLHRKVGFVYLATVSLSSIGAVYLATHTDGGWVFGAGLLGLAAAWLTTTGLAFVAVRRGLIQQHQEWMIRSYVVTFGFVTFRAFVGLLQVGSIGTLPEQLAAASWFCWAVPLLITEAVLQGRKILA